MSTPLSLRDLNDAFRMTFIGGRVMVTCGVAALPLPVRESILARVRSFDDFTEENDPHGEHDCGSFEQVGAGRIFWKIDYFEPTLTYGSADPADPKVTGRVLTSMLASEY